MDRIKVKFEFWQEEGSTAWHYTSLMGDDKLKVLYNFDLSKILPSNRAILVCQLWNQFVQLYAELNNPTTTGIQFKQNAIAWLQLFLIKSVGNFNSSSFIKELY